MKTIKSISIWSMMLPLALAGGTALAAAATSPFKTAPPPFSDQAKGKPVYYVTGVQADTSFNQTVFMCTNVGTKTLDLGVQVYNNAAPVAPANDIAADNGVVLTVAPGETKTIATGNENYLTADNVITGLPSIKQGSARIVSTDSKIICTVQLVRSAGVAGDAITHLNIFKATTQKGD
jgi:hypothetical protein